MGEYDQAELLKKFVQEEIEPRNVASKVNFDDAYENWKSTKFKKEIYKISKEWSVNGVIFEKAVKAYSVTRPDEIPYIEDLTKSVDYESIEKPTTPNKLVHNMELLKTLPDLVPKLKRKFK